MLIGSETIKPNILIVTNHEDVTADYVVLELDRRGIEFTRLNSEDLATASVCYSPVAGREEFVLNFEREELFLSKIDAAYFRRPGRPSTFENIEKGHREYCDLEWLSLLKSLYTALDSKWLNSPSAIESAENKPLQLFYASQMGFNIPETVVTNDASAAQKLLRTGKVVAKPLRNALVKLRDQEGVIFTTSVTKINEENIQSIQMAPIIFQRQIEKEFDVRVTVVGDKVFAVAIHSQEEAGTKVDWRKGSNAMLKHTVFNLPSDVNKKCVDLVKRLHLRFGAIDLIKDLDGKYWFLEINPNGQWAWIENRTGAPIASAIVDELIEIAGK